MHYKNLVEKVSNTMGQVAEDAVKVWHMKRYPDVSNMNAIELLQVIFGKHSAKKETPWWNPFDITVNVAILRRAQELIKSSNEEG